MRTGIQMPPKQSKAKRPNTKVITQNLHTNINVSQNVIKTAPFSAKLSSRSPAKKPTPQNVHSKPVKGKLSIGKSVTARANSKSSQQESFDNRNTTQSGFLDTSAVIFDENINPNQDVLNAHRFSAIQKPSKFVQYPGQTEEPSRKAKTRPQSMSNAPNDNRSLNSGLQMMTEEEYTQVYCRTEQNLDGCYTSASARENPSNNAKVQQNVSWNEEYSNGWGFQNQYRQQKMCLERSGDQIEFTELSPSKLLKTSPNYKAISKNARKSSHEAFSNTSMINEDIKKTSVQERSGSLVKETYSAKNLTHTKAKLQDCSANTKSTQSASSSNSARPNIVVKMFDPKADMLFFSNGDSAPFECNETQRPSNNATTPNDFNMNLDCEEMIEIGKIAQEMQPELQLQSTEMEVEPVSLEDELKAWEEGINSNDLYVDMFHNMIENEEDYTPDPHYFKYKQRELNWMMRAILIDWMMEVSSEFCLKRETFHIALNYVDRYLSVVANIQKWDLQLVGLTSLFVASKMEEVYPNKINDFAKSADDGYTPQQILDMELKMSKALKWRLVPTTIFTWANWYMVEWDNFLDSSSAVIQAKAINQNPNVELIQFKVANKESYTRFRELMQLIDCSVLNIESAQYKNRALVASFMYLLIGKYYKQFTLSEIIHEIPASSYFLFNDTQGLNHIFREFLKMSFGYQLEELLPTIQYAATFFSLPISYDLPHAAKVDPDNVLKGHYEEFLSYQTHYPANLKYVKNTQKK